MALYLNGNKIVNSLVIDGETGGETIPVLNLYEGRLNLDTGVVSPNSNYCYSELFDAPNGEFLFDFGEAPADNYIGVEMCTATGGHVNYWNANTRYRMVNHAQFYSQAPKLRLGFRKRYLSMVLVKFASTDTLYFGSDNIHRTSFVVTTQ